MIRRLRNLWRLSDIDTPPTKVKPKKLSELLRPQQAKIVDMKPFISDIPIINENNPAE